MKIAEELLETCKKHGYKLAVAESCTGGMITAALTDFAGSSAVVDRGFVTYSNEAKMQILGVDPKLITRFGAVSVQVAGAMADGTLSRSISDMAISVTGVAGPGASEAKPEGLVCFGLAMKARETETFLYNFGAIGRDEVRRQSVETAMKIALNAIGSR